MGSTVRTAAAQNLRSKVTRVEFGEPLLVNQPFVTIPLLWTAFAPRCGSVKASKVAVFFTEWTDREAVMWSPQTRIETALSLLWFVWTQYAVCVFHFSLYFSLRVLIWGSAGTRDIFLIPSPRHVFYRTGRSTSHPLSIRWAEPGAHRSVEVLSGCQNAVKKLINKKKRQRRGQFSPQRTNLLTVHTSFMSLGCLIFKGNETLSDCWPWQALCCDSIFQRSDKFKTLLCLSLQPSSRHPATAAHPGLSSLPPSGFPVIYTKSNYWYVKPLRCWPTRGRVTRADAYGPHGPQPAIQPVGEPASGVERI